RRRHNPAIRQRDARAERGADRRVRGLDLSAADRRRQPLRAVFRRADRRRSCLQRRVDGGAGSSRHEHAGGRHCRHARCHGDQDARGHVHAGTDGRDIYGDRAQRRDGIDQRRRHSCRYAAGRIDRNRTCSRSDALGAGATYPAVTVTVTVASTAPATVTNQVVATGGGDSTPANNSASDPTTITPSQTPTTLSLAVASGVYGGTTAVSATLSAAGSPVSGKTIAFTLQGVAKGTAVTNASGVATLANVSLTGTVAASYPTGAGASFAGDAA